MKLFIWAEPYTINYGTTKFIAVAETVEQAREIAKTAPAVSFGEYLRPNTPQVELGEPTQVMDIPCGQWDEWQE